MGGMGNRARMPSACVVEGASQSRIVTVMADPKEQKENRLLAFETDEFLVQINRDNILYAEKLKVLFNFKDITRITCVRNKTTGKMSAITFKMRGQLFSFQIDGFKGTDMEEMANLLISRGKRFNIKLVEKRA
jgi:hypothetical protein